MIRITSYITKEESIRYIRQHHQNKICKYCNADMYCKRLREKGYKYLEELDEIALQGLIDRMDGVNNENKN